MTKTLLPLLLLTGSVVAQNAFTSPAGLLTTEGSSIHDYILFQYNDMTFQQLDETSVGGTAGVVQRIAWRRDSAAAANASYAARTMDIEVVLSNAVKPGAISTLYGANFRGTPLTAFTRKSVNLPDWTQQPTTQPAPFDLVLQLDTPWVYLAQDPYLWQVKTWNNTAAATYGNDFQATAGSTGSRNAGTVLGTGCVATGQLAPMALTATITNVATSFNFEYGVTNAPATVPVLLLIGATDPNLSLPGLCAGLRTMPTLQVPMGISDASGTIPGFNVGTIAHSPGVIGATIYSQAVAVDGGLPGLQLALSNGRSNVIPADPATAPAPVTRVYGYRLSAGSMRAPSFWTGGIVTRLD
jgi:hypothetical protein